MMRATWLGAILLAGCVPPEAGPAPLPETCNGWEALCDRTWLELATPATHNSHASLDRGYLEPAANHVQAIPDQLAAGFRAVNIDTYEVDGAMVACHGYCEFGQQPLEEVYAEITDFLEVHPREVVWIALQDGAPLPSTLQALTDAGLEAQAWVFDGTWPTLGAMIEADRRVLLTGRGGGDGAPWYAAHRDLTRGTAYGYASLEAMDCDADLEPDKIFELSHTFLNPLAWESLSAEGNPRLPERVEACEAQHGRFPNLLVVDWFHHGDTVGVAAALNGVDPAQRQTPTVVRRTARALTRRREAPWMRRSVGARAAPGTAGRRRRSLSGGAGQAPRSGCSWLRGTSCWRPRG